MKYKMNLRYCCTMVAIMLVGMIFSPASAATATYTYDNLNRLTQVTYDNGKSIAYTYDAAGNITNVDKVAHSVPLDAPTVMTHAADNITSQAATLHGSVNANNAEANVIFEYGTTTAYGLGIDAEPGVVEGASDTSVSAALFDMAPATTYHFRIVATNSEGTSYGEDQSFTTLALDNDMDKDDIRDEWEIENYGSITLDRDDYANMDTDGDGYSDLEEYQNGTNINIPDKSIEDGYLILMGNVSYTLGTGSYTQVYGTAGTNNIVLESGAKAQCLDFPGNNTITLASESGLFTVSRSGLTVTLHGTDDTRVVLSATGTPQTIIFSDGAAELLVDGSDVVLGLQEILPAPAQVQTSLYEFFTDNETFSGDLEHPDAYLVLTGSESYTLPCGSSTVIHGSSDPSKITVESGAAVKILTFTGENIINILADYDQFEISRSGAKVHLQGLDGTQIYIPATTTAQELCFGGSNYSSMCASLVIEKGEVLLNDDVVPMADNMDDPAEEAVCDQGTMESFDDNVHYGIDSGIEFAGSPTGTAAVFSRENQSRIQYPYAFDFPTQGTIEFWIKVENGYRYQDYELMDNQDSALIFTTDIQGGDVTWPGSAWLYVYKNGDISFHIAGEKYQPGWDDAYRLRATGTAFRFDEWHKLGVSYGSLGRYIMLNGTIVASDTAMTETLGAGGLHSEPVDHPTIGESVSAFWDDNQWEGGFEGMVDKFRFSEIQKDWCLTLEADDAENLILYSDFQNGQIPSYSDWGKNVKLSQPINTVIENGSLVVSPKQGVPEGRFSFGNGASTIEFDFNVKDVSFDTYNLDINLIHSSLQQTSDSEIFSAVTCRQYSDDMSNTCSIIFDVFSWDRTNHVFTHLYGKNIGTVSYGNTYKALFEWKNNTISFYLDETLLDQYVLNFENLSPLENPYNIPGYFVSDIDNNRIGNASFKLTIDNIYTNIDYNTENGQSSK